MRTKIFHKDDKHRPRSWSKIQMRPKSRVLRKLPNSFCVKLDDGTGYIVWPGPIQPRGFEQGAIGLGKNAHQAWDSVKFL